MAGDVNWIYWAVFAVYLLYLLVTGIKARKQTKNISDYLVAGRNIGPVLMGLSIGVTYFSASLLIGSGGYAFKYGLGTLWIGAINAIVGTGLFSLIFGNRTRAVSSYLGSLTVPEMLGKRYQSKGLQIVTALVTFLFEIVYLVAVYMGLSSLFSVIMPDVPNAYQYALIFCGIITILYLVFGGSYGAIATDFVESMVMLFGVLFLLIAGLYAIGSLGNLNEILFIMDPGYIEFPGKGGFTLVGYIIVSSFAIFGAPQMISRFFTAKNKKSIKGGLVVSLLWAAFIAIAAYLNACIALGYNQLFSLEGLTANRSNIIPLYIIEVFGDFPWLGALFVACVAAASLTTEEKIILVASSAISRDFYQPITNCSDEKAMKVTKLMTIVIVIIAVTLAFMSIPEILIVTFFAFSSLASAVMVPYIYGLFWKKGTKTAAIITAVVCTFINVFWWFGISSASTALYPGVFPFLPKIADIEVFKFAGKMVKMTEINEFIPTTIIGLIIFPLISKFTKSPEKEFIEPLFDVLEGKTKIESNPESNSISDSEPQID